MAQFLHGCQSEPELLTSCLLPTKVLARRCRQNRRRSVAQDSTSCATIETNLDRIVDGSAPSSVSPCLRVNPKNPSMCSVLPSAAWQPCS